MSEHLAGGARLAPVCYLPLANRCERQRRERTIANCYSLCNSKMRCLDSKMQAARDDPEENPPRGGFQRPERAA